VLGFVVARALYDRFPEFSEGQLSKIRAHVVSRRSCAVVAHELGLDRRLEESGEIPDDLRRSSNVLAALMEAVLAALYLERGLDELAGPVIEAFGPRIEEALTESVDQKTTLQEELAKRGQRVEYVTLATDGPPHDRTFECAALVDGEQVGTGTGRTKKDAEQEAARMALDRLGLPDR
jgi:ribonuclease-3